MAPKKTNAREAREARERLRRYNARQTVHENQHKRRRRDNIVAVIGVVAVAAVAGALQLFYFNGGPGTPEASPSASASAAPTDATVPAPDFAEPRLYDGTIVLNGDVSVSVVLDAERAPQAVSAMLADSLNGYYGGKTCHRLVNSESAGLLQCGAVDAEGTSDAAYSYGPIENAPQDNVYPAGTIAVARQADDAYSNGHQFFIVFKDTTLPPDSAGGYTVVGNVTDNLDDLIENITAAGSADGSSDSAPLVPTTITSFTIQ